MGALRHHPHRREGRLSHLDATLEVSVTKMRWGGERVELEAVQLCTMNYTLGSFVFQLSFLSHARYILSISLSIYLYLPSLRCKPWTYSRHFKGMFGSMW